jgi:hypothetical protein
MSALDIHGYDKVVPGMGQPLVSAYGVMETARVALAAEEESAHMEKRVLSECRGVAAKAAATRQAPA